MSFKVFRKLSSLNALKEFERETYFIPPANNESKSTHADVSEIIRQRVKDKILDVMEEFHKNTCVRFRPRRGEASHIYLEPGKVGCSAIKGKIPDRANKVWLGFGCIKKGVIMHELMHALGFIHEQKRPDRDNYVRIDFANIEKGEKINFKKYREGEVYTFGQPYDYGSLMHYGPYDFAKDFKRPAVIPLQKDVRIGQRDGFSKSDLIKINLLYNCTGRS